MTKPPSLKLIEQGGKLRNRHRIKAERTPKPALGVGNPPGHLTSEQRELWVQVTDAAPPGLLTRIDADLIEGYVLLLSARNEAARQFAAEGSQVVTASRLGAVASNPILIELRRLTASLMALQAQLGFSPASRGKVSLSPIEGEPNPLDKFFPHHRSAEAAH